MVQKTAAHADELQKVIAESSDGGYIRAFC